MSSSSDFVSINGPSTGGGGGAAAAATAGAKSSAMSKEEQHAEASRRARNKLIAVSCFCALFMVAEIVGGFMANSLAIMTDAAHLCSDLAGFFISIFALWIANRPATSNLSFGFHRAEIIGALLSVLLIWVLTGILLYEAVLRLYQPEVVNGKLMFIMACLGLFVNIAMACILHAGGHGHSHGLGGGHGHSHGGGHGHSHGGGGSHGHSHGAPTSKSSAVPVADPTLKHHLLSDVDGRLRSPLTDSAANQSLARNSSHEHSRGTIEAAQLSSSKPTSSSTGEHQSSSSSARSTAIVSVTDPGADRSPLPKSLGVIKIISAKSEDMQSESDHDVVSDGQSLSEDGNLTEDEEMRPENVNVRAAYIHVLGDLLQTIGVMIAAAVIWWRPEYHIADPICTFIFSIIVLGTTVQLVRESLRVLMEGTPRGIDPDQVTDHLLNIDGVVEVHDLHIWCISIGKPALSVHLIKNRHASNVLRKAQSTLRRFGIEHTTIQVECSVEDHDISCGTHGLH